MFNPFAAAGSGRDPAFKDVHDSPFEVLEDNLTSQNLTEDLKLKHGMVVAGLYIVLSVLAPDGAFAKEKKPSSRSGYTAEQREKLYSQALGLCRNKYGTRLSRVQIDYRRKRFVCYIY